jgi:hypothetical protein
MGWRENGEWLAFPLRMVRARGLNDPRHELFRSVKEYVKTGDLSKVAGYLRSTNSTGSADSEIVAYERETVAWAIEMRQRTERSVGRRPDLLEKFVANMALGFYGAWRIVNGLYGDSAHGHYGEMKDLAASYVIEIWLEHLPITNDEELGAFWFKVRSLMDRDPSRRKLPRALSGLGPVFGRLLRAISSQNTPK